MEEIIVGSTKKELEKAVCNEDSIRALLPCNPEEFAEKYKEYKQAEAEFKKIYEPFKEGLLGLYKNISDLPSTIIIGGVKMSYVSANVRTSVDTKKLKEEEPEIAKKYIKTTEVDATIKITNV